MRYSRKGALLASGSAAAFGGGIIGVQSAADAAVIYSGPVSINIPSTTSGIYLNVVTGVSGTASGTPGWDVNPWSTGGLGLFNPSAPAGGVYAGTASGGTTALNEVYGTIIDSTSLFGSNTSTNNAQWNLNSSNNLIGFRFQNELNANAIHYGWMRISLSTTAAAQPRAIVEYAYESVAGVGIAAGVPEPASLGMLALGAVGLLSRRRATFN